MKKDTKVGLYLVMFILVGAGVYVGRYMAHAGGNLAPLPVPDRQREMLPPLPGQYVLGPAFTVTPANGSAADRRAALRMNAGVGGTGPDPRRSSSAPADRVTAQEAARPAAVRAQPAVAHTEVPPAVAKPGGAPRPDAPAPGTLARPRVRVHEIQPGERLWDIARQYYGKGVAWPRIKQANPGIDENALKPGARLLIP